MPRKLVLCLALVWAALAGAAPAPRTADQELLHNARFWEAHDRGDLAQFALKKLVTLRPDETAPLSELGELDLRLNDFADAKEVESELTRRFAGSEATRDFSLELRIATSERLQLASIRRLIELNRTADAHAALKTLFPSGPPGGALGIDYCFLLARTPRGTVPAGSIMRALAAQHPDDPRYELALAQLLVRESESAAEGVSLLQQLTERDDVRREDADRAVALGLKRLGAERAPHDAMSAYLMRHPEDSDIKALLTEHERLSYERELSTNVSHSHALLKSQRMLAQDLSSRAASVGGQAEARDWLARSRSSADAREALRAAAELRAAFAFYRKDYESEIAIASELETKGAPGEVGELLAAAARLDPKSSWLFETRLRWLIGHGESELALKLLRGSTLPSTLSPASWAMLFAQALKANAATELTPAELNALKGALERVVELSPRDPWMRFQLAELYRATGEAERGLSLMSEGVERASDEPDMRFALGLYLEHLEHYQEAYTAIDAVDARQRSEGMNALRERAGVAVARARARSLKQAGDLPGASSALLTAEPLAQGSFELSEELCYSWISLGDAGHGIALVEPFVKGPGANDPKILFEWARVLNSAEDDGRLPAVLTRLRAMVQVESEEELALNHMQRELDLREIRALELKRNYPEAARRLDALLGLSPQDRQLRLSRAELDFLAGRPHSARDRLASLAAENPDDLDARLSYVRSLTESGDIALAKAQLASVEARSPVDNEELQLSLARRQLGLGAAAKALHTLAPLLARPHPRTDVLILAAQAEEALHRYKEARDYLVLAVSNASGGELQAARRALSEIDERLQSTLTAGVLVWHQPGSPGMSQIDAVTIPSAWVFPRGDGSRFIVRADAVTLDAGRWSTSAQSPLLLGTIQAAGPTGVVRYRTEEQVGLSPGVAYQNASIALDIGATPLGFLLPNVVGGIQWSASVPSLDLALGVARRAVTSSELSYAGLKDPITGVAWGGVVQTGPYVNLGLYRENYDVSGSLRFVEITGTNVANNQLLDAHLSSSWKFLSLAGARADAAITLTYWSYERNLSSYTFGSGGYYSPQSYVSLATPLELTGERAAWSYRVRAAVSYTVSEVSAAAFYPDGAMLQAQGARAPLPPGYTSPYFSGYHSKGFGFSVYAATERALSDTFVVGLAVDIDRTDYYHPTSVEFYVRHALGTGSPHVAVPPRPLGPYNP